MEDFQFKQKAKCIFLQNSSIPTERSYLYELATVSVRNFENVERSRRSDRGSGEEFNLRINCCRWLFIHCSPLLPSRLIHE